MYPWAEGLLSSPGGKQHGEDTQEGMGTSRGFVLGQVGCPSAAGRALSCCSGPVVSEVKTVSEIQRQLLSYCCEM